MLLGKKEELGSGIPKWYIRNQKIPGRPRFGSFQEYF